MGLPYFIIVFFSNIIGAIVGIGGGIIIKPFLSLLDSSNPLVTSFYSSLAVCTMSAVAVPSHLLCRNKKATLPFLLVGGTGVIGGMMGNYVLEKVGQTYAIQKVAIWQSILLLLVLVVSYFMTLKQPAPLYLKGVSYLGLSGLFLGGLGSFLGIGGGPMNVSVLVWLFGFSLKEAGGYSLVIVLFSQLSKILSAMFFGLPQNSDSSLVPYIIFAAITGGLLGTYLKKKIDSQKFRQLVMIVIVGVIVITFVQFVSFLI